MNSKLIENSVISNKEVSAKRRMDQVFFKNTDVLEKCLMWGDVNHCLGDLYDTIKNPVRAEQIDSFVDLKNFLYHNNFFSNSRGLIEYHERVLNRKRGNLPILIQFKNDCFEINLSKPLEEISKQEKISILEFLQFICVLKQRDEYDLSIDIMYEIYLINTIKKSL